MVRCLFNAGEPYQLTTVKQTSNQLTVCLPLPHIHKPLNVCARVSIVALQCMLGGQGKGAPVILYEDQLQFNEQIDASTRKNARRYTRTGNHDISGAHEAVGQGVTASVVVVELGLGHGVVDVDGGEQQTADLCCLRGRTRAEALRTAAFARITMCVVAL